MISTRQREAARRRDAGASGFTLIEVMIALLVVALIATIGVQGVPRASPRATCARATAHMSGAIRFLFDRASITGKYHRLVIDLNDGQVLGRGLRRQVLRAATRRRREADRQKREDEGGRPGRGGAQAARRSSRCCTATAAARRARHLVLGDSSFDLSKLEVGDFRPKRARFAAFKETALKPVTLKKQLKIKSVYTPRMTDPVTAGRAYIYFYPLGPDRAGDRHADRRHGRERLLAGGPPDHRPGAHLQPGGPAADLRRPHRRRGEPGRPMSRRAAARRRGFTLLEIMVAIAILALTLVVLLSDRHQQRARDQPRQDDHRGDVPGAHQDGRHRGRDPRQRLHRPTTRAPRGPSATAATRSSAGRAASSGSSCPPT